MPNGVNFTPESGFRILSNFVTKERQTLQVPSYNNVFPLLSCES